MTEPATEGSFALGKLCWGKRFVSSPPTWEVHGHACGTILNVLISFVSSSHVNLETPRTFLV